MTELLPATGGVSPEPRIPLSRPSLPPLEDYVELLRASWESARLSNCGPYALRLEEACSAYGAWGNAVAMSSGDMALTLGVAALGLEVAAVHEAIAVSL